MILSRNLLIWIGAGTIAFGLWAFSARTRLHLVDPLTFIIYVAIAALGLTALLWWGLAERDPAEGKPEHKKENQ